MSTVFISREEALNRGELFDLTDETKAAGWPLDLAITRQAREACLDGQDKGAMRALIDGVEAAVVMAIILHLPPRRAICIDYRTCTDPHTPGLTLRVNFTPDGMPASATLGLRGEILRC